MEKESKHTPDKWKIVSAPVEQLYIIGEDGLYIATVHSQADGKRNEELKPKQQANAQRIVKAVNAYDEFEGFVKAISKANLDNETERNHFVSMAKHLLQQHSSH